MTAYGYDVWGRLSVLYVAAVILLLPVAWAQEVSTEALESTTTIPDVTSTTESTTSTTESTVSTSTTESTTTSTDSTSTTESTSTSSSTSTTIAAEPANTPDTTSTPLPASTSSSTSSTSTSVSTTSTTIAWDLKAIKWRSYVTLIENTEQCLGDCHAVINVTNPTDRPISLGGKVRFWYLKSMKARNLRGDLQVEVLEAEDVPYEVTDYTDAAVNLTCPTRYFTSNGTGTCTDENGVVLWSSEYSSVVESGGLMTVETMVPLESGSHTEYVRQESWRPFRANDRVLKPGETITLRVSGTKEPTTGENNVDWRLDFLGYRPEWAWWNSSWNYVKNYTVGRVVASMDGYPVPVQVAYEPTMRSDFGDVRFVDAGGRELNHYLYSLASGVSALFYVNMSVYSDRESLAYMYYGNPIASSRSNGFATFDFFDDFNTAPLNTQRWIANWSTDKYGVSGGKLWIKFGAPYSDSSIHYLDRKGIRTRYSFNQSRLETLLSVSTTGGGLLYGWRDSNSRFEQAEFYADNGMPYDLLLGAGDSAATCCKGTYVKNTYYTFGLREYSPVNHRLFEGGVQKLVAGSPAGWSLGKAIFGFQHWGGATPIHYIDWVILRKTQYPNPEPGVVFAGEAPQVGLSFSSFDVSPPSVLASSFANVSGVLVAGTRPLDWWWFTVNGSVAGGGPASVGVNVLAWPTWGYFGGYIVQGFANDSGGLVNSSSPVTVTVYTTTTTLPPASGSYGLTYDSAGNLVNDSVYLYEYNGLNMLGKVRDQVGNLVEEYTYGGSGNRVKKVQYLAGGGNRTTYYVSPEFETMVDEFGVRHDTVYVFVNGERLAEVYENNSKTYYLDDHLGSSSVLVDDSGNVVDRVTYFPFGDLRESGNYSKYGYNSKELDGTGLLYYGARYYNPVLKRWTQADSVIGSTYNPQLLNRYSYSANNPLKYIDPTGQEVTYSKNTAGGIDVYVDDAFFGAVMDGYRYEPSSNSNGGVFYDYSIRTSSTYGAPEGWSPYTVDSETSNNGPTISNVNTRIVMMSDLINYNNQDPNRKEAWEIYQLGAEAILSVGGLQYLVKGKKASAALKLANILDYYAGGYETFSAATGSDTGRTLYEASGFLPVWGTVKSMYDLSTYKGSGLSPGQEIPEYNKPYIIGYYYSPNMQYSSIDLSYSRGYGNSNSWYLGGTRACDDCD